MAVRWAEAECRRPAPHANGCSDAAREGLDASRSIFYENLHVRGGESDDGMRVCGHDCPQARGAEQGGR